MHSRIRVVCLAPSPVLQHGAAYVYEHTQAHRVVHMEVTRQQCIHSDWIVRLSLHLSLSHTQTHTLHAGITMETIEIVLLGLGILVFLVIAFLVVMSVKGCATIPYWCTTPYHTYYTTSHIPYHAMPYHAIPYHACRHERQGDATVPYCCTTPPPSPSPSYT